MARLGRTLLWLLCVLCLASSAHVLVGAYAPLPGQRAHQSSADALESAITQGAAERAQALFPEGAFFMHALTGLAQARLGGPDNLARARAHLQALLSPELQQRFGDAMVPEHGIFAAGWSLELAVAIAASSNDPQDLAVVEDLARPVVTALGQSQSPYLASYPGQFWPCDTVVAVAALQKASRLPSLDPSTSARYQTARDTWLGTLPTEVQPHGDSRTRRAYLIAHRTDATGATLEGPRGTSQAIIQTAWPDIVSPDPVQWQGFVDRFVVRRAGLVGVVEYPSGSSTGGADVDSGPLIAGVSLSATAVTAGAARAHGDGQLANDLLHQAEVFGLPSRIGPHRYGLGLMPIGEAFLVASHTQPVVGASLSAQAPRPLWWAWWLPGVSLAAMALGLVRRRRAGSARGAAEGKT